MLRSDFYFYQGSEPEPEELLFFIEQDFELKPLIYIFQEPELLLEPQTIGSFKFHKGSWKVRFFCSMMFLYDFVMDSK